MSGFGDLEDNAPHGGYSWSPEPEEPAWDASNDPQIPTLGNLGSGEPQPEPERTASPQPSQVDQNPQKTLNSDSSKLIKKPRITVVVSKAEVNKAQDPVFTFDVSTTLPRFRQTTFRGVRRSYSEIRKFANYLASANPECFVPVLPPPATSFPTSSPENISQLRMGIQKWFERVTRSPLLARDEEFAHFVQYTSGYNPVVKFKPPATGLARKVIKQFTPPTDDVAELHEFRPVAKLVYQYSTEGHSRVLKVARCRKALAGAYSELALRFASLVQSEEKKGMINMWTRLAKVVGTVGDIENAKATLFEGYYGDALEQLAREAYSIKETLTNRHILMRDLIKCQGVSAKQYEIATRLKSSGNISPAKVNEAINQFEDAKQTEKRITSAVRRVTENLVAEKPVALSRMESDIMTAISQYALRIIDADRKALSVWESIRRDVRAVDSRGGLSKLGRDGPTRRAIGVSQSLAGDSWSGDRQLRAKDLLPHAQVADEVVDAKSAASLLSESVF